jgi:iron-sulfur cluster repair protein YtfE (RIC family)
MTVALAKTVRELALENPSSTRIFEKLGIDYCCGGNISLETSLPNCQPGYRSSPRVA